MWPEQLSWPRTTILLGMEYVGLARQHEVEKALPARHAAGVRRVAGEMQKPDACGECGVRAQVGVLNTESEIDERLPDRIENSLVGCPHAGGDRVVGACPFAHGPFQRPMPGAQQRGHHLRQALAGWDSGHVAEMAAILV